jgi:hypothetical protein
MNELFPIDEKARKENLNPSDRHLLRLEEAKLLLEQIKTAILAARGFPKSDDSPYLSGSHFRKITTLSATNCTRLLLNHSNLAVMS